MAGGVSSADLRKTLEETFQPTNLIVLDASDGCGSKFQVFISSDKWNGVGLLERQRQVNDAVKPYMQRIHALELKTWTTEQWQQKQHLIPKAQS